MENRATDIPVVHHNICHKFPAIYIVSLSDMQIGNPGFDEALFLGYTDWILSIPNAYVILPGDIYEAPVVGNRASDFFEMALTPKQAKKKAHKLLKPLVKRILGAVSGNHDQRMYKVTGHDPIEILLESLNLPVDGKNSIYDPINIIIEITLDENPEYTYKIDLAHGWGGARKTGAHVNKNEEMASVVTDADVYVLGHEHTLYVSRWDSENIGMKGTVRQYFVGSGTFCRYTRFQKGIQRRLPNLGSPRIRLEGTTGLKGHKDTHVSI